MDAPPPDVARTRAHALSLRLLGWLVAASLLLVHVWMLNRYSVNFPFQDDFTQFVAVPNHIAQLPTWREKIAYLFSSSGDHRVVTLRLAALVQTGFLGGLDFKMLTFFANLLCTITGLLVLSCGAPSLRAFLAPLAAGLLLSPTNYIAQFWASAGLQHLGLIAYAFGALYCLSRSGVAWEAAGLVLGLCAVLTGANGLLVLPVGAALLYARDRHHTAAFWAVLTLVICPLYFIGHQPPPGHPLILDGLTHPFRLLVSCLATLGSMLARFEVSAMLGLALVMAWIWLIASRRSRPNSPLLVAWMAFLVACAGTIAVGRALLGDDEVVNSRYRIYSELSVLITIIALTYRMGSRKVSWLLSIMLALVAMWSWKNWEDYLPHVADLATRQRNAIGHYALTGHGDYGEWPPQDAADLLLNRAHDLGAYSIGKVDQSGRLIESARSLLAAGRPALWSTPPFVYANAISVRGQTWMSKRDVTLWLQDDAHRYRGPMHTQRVFNEIVGQGRLVFWNTFPLQGVASGHYRVGYALGDETRPDVVWTDDWIDLK